jgi:nicotinamidase-related amidase
MAATFTFDPAHTAVLSMDCQAGIVSIYTREGKDAFLVRVASVLNYARAAGMTIIHVQVPGTAWSEPGYHRTPR